MKNSDTATCPGREKIRLKKPMMDQGKWIFLMRFLPYKEARIPIFSNSIFPASPP